jgi:hypothetical protein
MIDNPEFPDLPKSEKEVYERVANLIDSGEEYLIPPWCKGGTGAPGNMLEAQCGSQGGNGDIFDAARTELKFKYGQSLLTLMHKKLCSVDCPEGGDAAVVPFVKRYGRIDKEGRLSFRHTVGRRSKKFRVARARQTVIIRPLDETDKHEVYWNDDDLINAVCSKFRNTVLVFGKVRKVGDKKYIKYNSALHLTKLKSTDFLNAIGGQYVIPDFDMREKHPGSVDNEKGALRDHGTKLRMKIRPNFLLHAQEIWGVVETHETIKKWKGV